MPELRKNGFKVWAQFFGSTTGSMFGDTGTKIYDANENRVGTSPAWEYDNTKYWINGTYHFFALYPESLDIKRNADGTPQKDADNNEIPNVIYNNENFQFGYDVANQVDILVATPDQIAFSGTDNPSTVALNFYHPLCQLEFQAISKSTDKKAVIYGVDIYDAASTGTYSFDGNKWDWQTPSQSSTNTLIYSSPSVAYDLNGVDYTTVVSGVMMIPQNLENIYIKVRYQGLKNGQPDIIASEALRLYIEPNTDNQAGHTEWIQGKKYTYRLSVTEYDLISFSPPTVTEWNTASGGNFIVDTK